MSGWDQLSEEALERLGAWPPKSRELFKELVEDATSEMQRELLQRAVAAGHSPAEVHAFADELRGLDDDAAFTACTLDADAPEGYTVVQLLRAEADPLYAFELKGNTLSPADEDEGQGLTATPTRELDQLPYVVPETPTPPRVPRAFDTGKSDPSLPKARPLGFDDVNSSGRHKRVDLNDLGQSVDATPRARPPSGPVNAVLPAAPVPGTKLMEDLLNESTRALGVSYREQDVDDGHLTLEAAIATAAGAVGRGIPVPVVLGPALSQHRRLAVLLQLVNNAGKRAWQMYDPLSGELYWVNEGDLLARTELPFNIKTNRRITRIALPIVKATTL